MWGSDNPCSVVTSQLLRLSLVVDCEEIKVSGEVLSSQAVVTL